MLENFLTIKSTYNGEWWFLFTFIIAILTLPFMKKIIAKNCTSVNLFIIIVLAILTQRLFPALGNLESLGKMNDNYFYKVLFCQTGPNISCYWIGILFAKDDLLIKIKNNLKQIN